MPRLSFSPAKHGFHFGNSFDNIVATLPNGVQLKTRGRCGGMSYAALDYLLAGLPVPTHLPMDFGDGHVVPPDGSVLADYILKRLYDSFLVPSALNFITWTLTPDHDTWFRKGTTKLMREQSIPALRAAIDQGRHCVLGLVNATSLEDIGGNNHQVVAYGYEAEASGDFRIFIYDCNSPDVEQVLTLAANDSHLSESPNGANWRAFFVTEYAPVHPPYIDVAVTSGITVRPDRLRERHPLSCQAVVTNIGQFAAHFGTLHYFVRGPHGENLDGVFVDPTGSPPLQPGESVECSRSNDEFGKTSGRHTLSLGYLSELNEWSELPNGNSNAQNRVTVMLEHTQLRISVSPASIPAGLSTDVTVTAVDADDGSTQHGEVYFDDVRVGETGVPFAVKLDHAVRGRLVVRGYEDVLFVPVVELGELKAEVTDPIPIPLDKLINLTVRVTNAQSGQSVPGARVHITNRRSMPNDPPQPADGYDPSAPFAVTFHGRLIGNPRLGDRTILYPTASVSAPNYHDISLALDFLEQRETEIAIH